MNIQEAIEKLDAGEFLSMQGRDAWAIVLAELRKEPTAEPVALVVEQATQESVNVPIKKKMGRPKKNA